MTRKERDMKIYELFNNYVGNGMSKTEATGLVQRHFGFLTPVPVYNARRRVKERKEAENG